MPTKTDKVSVSVRMPADMYQALKILANAEERSLSKQIIYAIGEWMQMKRDEEEERNTEAYGSQPEELMRVPDPGLVISWDGHTLQSSPSQSPSRPPPMQSFQASPSDSYSMSSSASPSPSAPPDDSMVESELSKLYTKINHWRNK